MNKMAEKNDQKMRERAERAEKFQAKLQELLALAKKKKNMLEYQEINDHFKDFALSPEQIDKILDFLEANHVDVLRITDDDDDILIDDEDNDVEVEKIDLSVPDGVAVLLLYHFPGITGGLLHRLRIHAPLCQFTLRAIAGISAT